jgi:hypothetical protein
MYGILSLIEILNCITQYPIHLSIVKIKLIIGSIGYYG